MKPIERVIKDSTINKAIYHLNCGNHYIVDKAIYFRDEIVYPTFYIIDPKDRPYYLKAESLIKLAKSEGFMDW